MLKKKPHSKEITFLILGLAVGLILAILLLNKAGSTAVYTDSKNSFSINVPEKAEILANTQENFVAFKVGEGEEIYSVGISAVSGVFAESTKNELLDAYKNNLPDYKLISETKKTMGTNVVYEFVHSWTNNEVRVIQKQDIILAEGRIFVITFTTSEKLFAKNEKYFETVLSSFRAN